MARFTGSGRFVAPHVVEVAPLRGRRGAPVRLRGRVILVATGSRPSQPKEFPFGHPRVWDSDRILELERMPARLAVIGAGVIGSEYACMFATLGTRVHLIDGRDTLLPFLDPDLSKTLATAMAKQGVVFHWKENVAKCKAPKGGSACVGATSSCCDACAGGCGPTPSPTPPTATPTPIPTQTPYGSALKAFIDSSSGLLQ